MKADFHKKIFNLHSRMRAKDKLYGTTTLGARGQLVIPAQARKDLKLEPGDQVVVMGKFGKVLGLMKTDQMAGFVETIMSHLSGSGMEDSVKRHFEKLFSQVLEKSKSKHH